MEKASYGCPAGGKAEDKGVYMQLGAPWDAQDALALCAALTGVVARVCSEGDGQPHAGAGPCRMLSAARPGGAQGTSGGRLYNRCPLGVPCACIPLSFTQTGRRGHVWVSACAGRACEGVSAPFSDAQARAPHTIAATAAGDFELALELLTVMADHVQHIGAAAVPARPRTEALTARQSRLVRALCRAVHARGADPGLRLGAFAAAESVTVAYLCTLFTRGVGVPFRSYLQVWRLQQVKSWLLEDRLSIKEIAAQAGYNGANRLRLAFKSATGLSPRRWREARLAETVPREVSGCWAAS